MLGNYTFTYPKLLVNCRLHHQHKVTLFSKPQMFTDGTVISAIFATQTERSRSMPLHKRKTEKHAPQITENYDQRLIWVANTLKKNLTSPRKHSHSPKVTAKSNCHLRPSWLSYLCALCAANFSSEYQRYWHVCGHQPANTFFKCTRHHWSLSFWSEEMTNEIVERLRGHPSICRIDARLSTARSSKRMRSCQLLKFEEFENF